MNTRSTHCAVDVGLSRSRPRNIFLCWSLACSWICDWLCVPPAEDRASADSLYCRLLKLISCWLNSSVLSIIIFRCKLFCYCTTYIRKAYVPMYRHCTTWVSCNLTSIDSPASRLNNMIDNYKWCRILATTMCTLLSAISLYSVCPCPALPFILNRFNTFSSKFLDFCLIL